jgi:glycosyltransferase involved in cell wall biosynthesis
MNVLFLSNYYPPRTHGGYEQWCQEVAIELTRRGHQVCVLTSGGEPGPLGRVDEAADHGIDVRRGLHLEVESGLLGTSARLITARRRLELSNLGQVRRAIAEFRPDAALVWGMWNVPRSVPALVEELLGSRVCFYFCDYWPSLPTAYVQQFEAPAERRMSRLPKQLIGRVVAARLRREPAIKLRFEHPICVSRAVRDVLVQACVPVAHARVVYGGTTVSEFVPVARPSGDAGRLRLLYAGRLTATKGVHTALRAMALLAASGERRVSLDVVGSGDPAYEKQLRRQARDLDGRVTFRSGVSRAEMSAILAQRDGLLLLSEWDEPFARVVLEAMAGGLVVIGTCTGGTGEVLVDGETGLTFPPGDAAALARQIQCVVDDTELRGQLAAAARRRVSTRFTLSRMVDELEAALDGVAMRAS